MIPLLVAAAWGAPPAVDPVVQAASPRHLLVSVGEDVGFSRSPGDWTVSGPDGSRSVAALAVRTRADELIPEGWPYPVVLEHTIVLELDAAWTPGAWTVQQGANTWTTTLGEGSWTPAVQVNQVGWRTDAPGRFGYAGYWLAGLGDVDLTGQTWRVVDVESGDTVLSGTWSLRLAAGVGTEDAYGNNYANADVFEADLGALDAPGDYALVWDGVGSSFPFTVADDVYDEPFRTAFRAIWHQRCGAALDPSLTDWSHAECHSGPIELTTADYNVVGEDAFDALQSTATGVTVAAKGGYHDAGDYSRRTAHFEITDALLDLYEIDPQRHGSDDLGIADSGNGIPDLVDEAGWGLGLYAALQGDSGGIRGGADTTGYPSHDLAPDADDATPWYAYAEDPLASYRFAGAAARFARTIEPFDAAASAEWLDRAQRAWTWAEANPRGYDTRVAEVKAAVELLESTGDPAFDTIWKERGPFAGGDLGWRLADWDGFEWYPALYAYATAEKADPAYREAAKQVLVARADSWVTWADGTGRRFVKHPYAGIAVGAGTTPVEAGLLLRVHAMTGDDRYLRWASYTCDQTLGANPSGWSWVTGLGDRPVEGIFHTPSLADDLADPLPGIPIYGPAHYTSASGIHEQIVASFDPPIAEWPILERYADATFSPVINEFTVHESIAPAAFAFGYLAAWEFTAEPDPDDGESPEDSDRPALAGDREGGCGCAAGARSGALAILLSLVCIRTKRGRNRPRT
jgi:endoglucanase